jgi:hypothetical protein
MTDAPAVTDHQRITVALIPKAAGDLAGTVARTGMSKTDVVNRAVSLYEFIDGEMAAGTELILRHADGTSAVLKLL